MKLQVALAVLVSAFVTTGLATADDASELSYSAVTIRIDEDGKGTVVVDSRSPEEAHVFSEPGGEPLEVSVLAPAEVFGLSDRRMQLRYVFSEIEGLDQLKRHDLPDNEKDWFKQQIWVDSEEGLLVLDPQPGGSVLYSLPRLIRPPLEVTLHLAMGSQGVFDVTLSGLQSHLLLSLQAEGFPEYMESGSVVLSHTFLKEPPRILFVKRQPPGTRTENTFSYDPVLANQATRLFLRVRGDIPLGIPSIEIKAKLPPYFGVELSQRTKRVFVRQVISGSPGELAGVKRGDTLVAINGESVESALTALHQLAESPWDQKLILEVERYGRRRVIEVKPE